MANFSKFNLPELAEQGYELTILDPIDNEPTDVIFTVRGMKSKKVREFMVAKMKQERKAEKARKGKKEDDDLDLEQLDSLDASMAEITANRVITFRNVTVTNDKGKEVELEPTEENILMLMQQHEWIREQILKASNDLVNFRPK